MDDVKKLEDQVKVVQATGDVIGSQRLEDGGILLQVLVKPIPYPKPPPKEVTDQVKKLYDDERQRVYEHNMLSLRGIRNDVVVIVQEVLA